MNVFDVFKDHFLQAGIVRNEITRLFEKQGKELSEEAVNSIYIELYKNHHKIKGFTKKNYEIFLASKEISTINYLKDYLNGLPQTTGTKLIDQLVSTLHLKRKEYYVSGNKC